MKGLFVTGTDTGVGKSLVSTALLTVLASRGIQAVGFKPVAAGIDEGAQSNDDVLALQAGSVGAPALAKVGPFQFRQACAPHIAAALEGVALPRQGWLGRAKALAEQANVVVAEGAGGFCVPLSQPSSSGLEPRWGLDDVAADLGFPVVLVVGLRLGCLNHALLTAQAVRAKGLHLAGWVGNRVDPAMPHADDNIASLQAWLDAPCWGVVPWMSDPDRFRTAQCLDADAVYCALLGGTPC